LNGRQDVIVRVQHRIDAGFIVDPKNELFDLQETHQLVRMICRPLPIEGQKDFLVSKIWLSAGRSYDVKKFERLLTSRMGVVTDVVSAPIHVGGVDFNSAGSKHPVRSSDPRCRPVDYGGDLHDIAEMLSSGQRIVARQIDDSVDHGILR
jgi:hypothetical protein